MIQRPDYDKAIRSAPVRKGGKPGGPVASVEKKKAEEDRSWHS